MKLTNEFGAIVCAAPGDYLFAKGTCASIRYFMPDLPIALLVDGNLQTDLLEQTYQVQVIRKTDITDPWLAKHSFGWGITKMLAFWYSPFERFLYLDSDTIVWGDIRQLIEESDWDFVSDIARKESDGEISDEAVARWFFDLAFVEGCFPDFPWRKYKNQFMCTGVFIAKKNAFSAQEYKEILALQKANPTCLHFAEMGFLNIMIFRNFHHGKLNLSFADYQVIFPDFPKEQLQYRFRFEENKPVINKDDVRVLHMPGEKPLINNSNCYSLPMTYFRLKFLKDSEGLDRDSGIAKLLVEDQEYYRLKKRRTRINVLKRLLVGQRGEWRSLVNRYKSKFLKN